MSSQAVALWIIGLGVAAAFAARQIHRFIIMRQRRAKRFSTHLITRILPNKGTAEIAATVLDLSCNGAKVAVAATSDLEMGATLQILMRDNWHQADVVWSNAHYLGLEFDKALSIAAVADLAVRKPQLNLRAKDKAAQITAPPNSVRRLSVAYAFEMNFTASPNV